MDSNHEKLLDELKQIGHWHHRINLGENIFTNENKNAPNPETKWNLIEPFVPKDLSGKSVLDIGCNSGFFSVQMKKRGAARVVSVDKLDDAIKQTNFLSEWYDVDLEVVKEEAHIYCLTTEEQFDYVLFLGLFYHLKYPVLVLDRLSEMTKSRLYFQSQVVGPEISKFQPDDDYSDGASINKSKNFPKLFFIEKKYLNSPGNWWLPNESAMISLLRNAQMKIIARPSKAIFVAEPNQTFGKKIVQKNLVFPKYGKRGFIH